MYKRVHVTQRESDPSLDLCIHGCSSLKQVARHGSVHFVGNIAVYGRASHATAFSRGEAVAGFGDPRTRPKLHAPSSPGHHGLAFYWRDAAAHPPGNARLCDMFFFLFVFSFLLLLEIYELDLF